MNFVKLFNLFGVDAMQIPCILGNGAPTSATEGAIGCLYMDTDTGNLYKCTGVDNGSYSWKGIADSHTGGDLDMGGNDIKNAENIHAARVYAVSVAVQGTDGESGAVFEAEPNENDYAVVCLYGAKGDEATILRNVAPGIQGSDAVNMDQFSHVTDLVDDFNSDIAALYTSIGDIETALDAIIAIQEELIGVTLITFFVVGDEYTAEAGMTWGEWENSEYNTNGFFNDGIYMSDDNGCNYLDPDGNMVTPDMVIIADAHYDY